MIVLGNWSCSLRLQGPPPVSGNDADGRQIATIEGSGAAPTANISPTAVSQTATTINATASEPVVVASITYWPDGGSESTGITLSQRLDTDGGAGGTTYGQSSFVFNPTGLNPGTLYHDQVTLTDRTGASQSLAAGVLLGAPQSLTATLASGQVSLSWAAVSGATSYDVYRGSTPGGEGATPYATGIAGTSYTDTSVTDGNVYYYFVTPVASGGQGAASNEVGLVTQ